MVAVPKLSSWSFYVRSVFSGDVMVFCYKNPVSTKIWYFCFSIILAMFVGFITFDKFLQIYLSVYTAQNNGEENDKSIFLWFKMLSSLDSYTVILVVTSWHLIHVWWKK